MSKKFFATFPLTAPTLGITAGGDLVGLVQDLTNWFFVGFLLTAVVFVIIAASQFLTGGGDPVSLGSAKKKLIWAAVAVIIAVLARAIPLVVENIITASPGGDTTDPAIGISHTPAGNPVPGSVTFTSIATDSGSGVVVTFINAKVNANPYSIIKQCDTSPPSPSVTCTVNVSYVAGDVVFYYASTVDSAGNSADTLPAKTFTVTP